MLKKILCVAAAAVMLSSCSFDFLSSKKDSSAGTSSGASEKEALPEITLPNLPATVNSYGGQIFVSSIKLKDNYNKTENSIGATVSMQISGANGSTCIVDFNILDENGTVVDSGNMGNGTFMNNGDTYEGSFYIMGVQPGKKYTMKFIES